MYVDWNKPDGSVVRFTIDDTGHVVEIISDNATEDEVRRVVNDCYAELEEYES